MDEAEWLACSDAGLMLEFLRCKASDRKLRLFACALGRLLWDRLGEQPGHRAVEVAERVADGLIGRTNLASVFGPARRRAAQLLHGVCAHTAAAWSANSRAWAAAHVAASYAGMTGLRKAGVVAALREVFANPFRPVQVDPAWLTPDVVQLAQAAYDERLLPSGELDPQRLLVLADALEDAGCQSADVLGHLRGPGVHVRGCWVIDWVTGRE